MAVAKIDRSEIIDTTTGLPVDGGVNDMHMGVVDKNVFCKTCRCNSSDCPGHPGYIELEKPMYHVGFIETCKKILRSVCFNCSRLLILSDEKKMKEVSSIKNPKKRSEAVFKASLGVSKCADSKKKEDDTEEPQIKGCGYKQPSYKKGKDQLAIAVDFEEASDDNPDRVREMSAEECHKIFKRVSAEDCLTMGFDPAKCRPDWMVITVLMVCPPQIRPSVAVDTVLRSEDDLTFVYNNIVKANNQLKKQEETGAGGHLIQETLEMMQFHVATLMNNELSVAQSQQRSGRPIKAISARLKGKEGRLRGNLMGKRVDFSARTVITPDPNLSLDELGVPLSIAMNLTFPEVVTPQNIYRMRELIENGPTEWPGAKFIIRDDGARIDLRYLKKRSDIHLDKGYIVERHMQNGDYVLFNRQPSLHKMSIMGHRVRILPYSTFRLNLSVTSPYNADFDGDEMNLHLPQSQETKAEIKEIMHVPKQIVSPQSNKPVMGIVQDSLIGIKMFTEKDTFVEKDVLMNLLMWIPDFDGEIPIPAILKPVPLWSGKQIISLILPNVNLERFSSNHSAKFEGFIHPADSRCIIENGQLLSGLLCKKTVKTSGGGLIHIIWNEHGPHQTMLFFNAAQKVVNNWMLESGFTVGICDTISTEEVNQNIVSTLDESKIKVKEVLIEAQEGKLECQPGKSMLETFEDKVNKILNEARDNAGKFVQDFLSYRNHIKNMVIAGSKGSDINLCQIIACVGQQNVEGKRIPFSFNKRTLPHFTKDDFGPESRGFVENSYLAGLTAQEFFFHAMGGREGLIDTAVKTAETGYIQRRLVKALEDVMIKYDGTVRNSSNQVYQFLYGEDGFGGEFIEDQKLDTMMMDNKKLEKHFRLINPNWSEQEAQAFLKPHLEPEIVEEILFSDNSPEIKVKLDEEFEKIRSDRETLRNEIFEGVFEDKQHFPININRIMLNAKKKFNISVLNKSNLNPAYVIDAVEQLKKRLILVKGEDEFSKEAQANGTLLIFININAQLASKRIITERITKVAFDWMVGEVESRFFACLACPGEMVGNIAAQSIGEPATQMTLNTFHFAGVSSKNVTLGVPRLKEVINVAKQLKTPSMWIYMDPSTEDQKATAKKLQAVLEHTSLQHVALSSRIFYDPDPKTTVIEEDLEMVEMHSSLNYLNDVDYEEVLSPWVIRVELDQIVITDRNLSMEDITRGIENTYKDIEIVASDLNAKQMVIRVRRRFNSDGSLTRDEAFSEESTKNLENILIKDTSLSGIPEIKKVYVKPSSRSRYNAETGQLEKDAIEEWEIETDGNNLSQVFNIDEVDFTRTYSNDILEIVRLLGIEAVRMALFRELRNILKPYDIYVNFRHIATLCDAMTNRGYLTSITRHGINRLDLGPMRKSTFEETVDILLEAGLYGETDQMNGISENIMVGQLAPLGTGSFDVFLDADKLKDAKHIQDLEEVEETAKENEEDDIFTPVVASTPVDVMRTVNPSATPMGVGNSPVWTDYQPNYGNTPRNDSFIITPHYAPQDNALSTYMPNADTQNPVYSPLIDLEDSGYNKNSSAFTPNTPKVYSPYGAPDSQHGMTSRYQAMTPNMDQGGYSSRYTPLSPGKQPYSPTTPFQASRYSHDASGAYVPSNYSIGSSPRVQDSISSAQSNNLANFTPGTPVYNPRSPGYNVMMTSSLSLT